MDNQTAQSMLNGLLAIKAEGPKRDQSGICNNLERLTDRAYSHWEMVELFKTWEHFSGDETFPVRHPNRKPDIAYLCAEKSIWDKKTLFRINLPNT